MYKRPHHQKIVTILAAMNSDFLRDAKCYFGGGTAISLLLDEFRESVDIDFLCADQEGYRKLRSSIFNNALGDIFTKSVDLMREVKADRDGIRTVLSVDGTPIKFEIVREARVDLSGTDMPNIPVPCLTKNDLFAEKLLANADRYGDKSVMSRDVIDILVMESNWGAIPQLSWTKAESAYGESVQVAFKKAIGMLRSNPQYLSQCLEKMGIDDDIEAMLRERLGIERNKPTGFEQ